MKRILKKAKYTIITSVVVGAVLMHFALAALFFSDSTASGVDKPRQSARAARKYKAVKKKYNKKHGNEYKPGATRIRRPVAKQRIASGKIKGIVRGRGAMGAPLVGNPVSAKIVAGAKKHIGVDYLWGGTDPEKGFDCSGYTQYVLREAGIVIPRVARRQFDALRTVKEPMPGDLVFFAMDGNDINHVGIYMGNGRFLHAPKTGDVVKYSSLNSMFWRTKYIGAGAAF